MKPLFKNYSNQKKLIPFEPSKKYKSLEYTIKKLLSSKLRMTLFELLDFLFKLENSTNIFWNFKISKTQLNRKKITKTLLCLCKENKVIKVNNYFEKKNSKKNCKIIEIVNKKKRILFLVFLKETKSLQKKSKI